ncbi:hypothetical protein FOCC_FOCC003115 [Frankliniella occidentalis]|nr:hypothetical protein FOCC_FOCC003115 [Frankliniella occidentalis]
MEPTTKLGYLRSYEAVLDAARLDGRVRSCRSDYDWDVHCAGLHPQALRGSNTGVFACGGVNEFEQKIFYSSTITTYEGYIMMGFLRTMLPNRLSYYFNFNGKRPSYAVDGSWVGGHLGLQQAARAVREGECDAAIVVAGSISRYGETSLLLNKLGLVTDEGVTRSFDANGGYSASPNTCIATTRSTSAFGSACRNRGDQAKRCYARVLATEVEFIAPRCDLDLTLPSPEGTRDFLRRIYRKHAIDPKTIAYLEADGSGSRIRDACELNAIDQALVQEAARASPLQIGSVKSNIGHVDCVNGLAAICKIVVAMETGIIPATINFLEPNSEATGLVAGRLKVVDKNTPLRLFEDSVLAVNTMALSNMMGHTIQSAPFDTNYYRLLQDVFSDDIRGYNYRGFVICPSTGKDTIVAFSAYTTTNDLPITHQPLEKRAVWFVYSGMGSQWAGMGVALMRLPLFAETIERLHAVLEPRGVDLKAILTDTGPTAFDNILKSFVGITACQIALTNVLTAVGVLPDGIVGHSLGEQVCAYADGCLTEDQAILAAFARGKASKTVPFIKGKMAAIGKAFLLADSPRPLFPHSQ